ncbi:BLUF domain-containing protein [Ramlibacter sp. G-1-2-2]|uniref:BLUF domain-containing protein n=1 Tax=Ramlibacter agri TaxID=2728837 RepID=A0A848HEV7_9BURK|nr:BLUF domain-containing protein [Ramlibacter agri]NML48010.1 BLUF domain-containing protein [Ramlibacter agri]
MPVCEKEHGAASTGEAVARIVYASQAAATGSIYSEMERIRASAVRHNPPAGVATALLHQSGWFVQWKEGPQAAVASIMERVAGDPRHCGLRVVHRSVGPRLLHGPWSMAIVQCDEPASDMGQRVDEVLAAVDRGTAFTPPAIWRRLSTPMRHPGARRQQDPDAFQRVLVCAAGGTGSFDLVRWLSQRFRAELVQRRFAGAHDLDVATDYVDFIHGERVLRVIAMARNGLHLPLTRAFLADYSHLVLLLSGDATRDEDLVLRMAQACAGLAEAPPLIALARQGADHAVPFAMARRCGLVYLQAHANLGDPWSCWQALMPLLERWQDMELVRLATAA